MFCPASLRTFAIDPTTPTATWTEQSSWIDMKNATPAWFLAGISVSGVSVPLPEAFQLA